MRPPEPSCAMRCGATPPDGGGRCWSKADRLPSMRLEARCLDGVAVGQLSFRPGARRHRARAPAHSMPVERSTPEDFAVWSHRLALEREIATCAHRLPARGGPASGSADGGASAQLRGEKDQSVSNTRSRPAFRIFIVAPVGGARESSRLGSYRNANPQSGLYTPLRRPARADLL